MSTITKEQIPTYAPETIELPHGAGQRASRRTTIRTAS